MTWGAGTGVSEEGDPRGKGCMYILADSLRCAAEANTVSYSDYISKKTGM